MVARNTRVGRLQELIETNGLEWTVSWMTFEVLRAMTYRVGDHLQRLEHERGTPGHNSVSRNFAMWDRYDWSTAGEEWTPGPQWKLAFIEEVLLRYVEHRGVVLEIGPGAGRWTAPLQQVADRLILVDISPRCIELCRRRFGDHANIEYFVNQGNSLEFLSSSSVDRIWSYDVFVHVAPPDIDCYLGEMRRVLRPGGRGIIHHSRDGSMSEHSRAGWRSSMTAGLFATMLAQHGLRLVSQLDSWGPDGRYHLPPYGDIISVFGRD
jgi:SAM-dependent methyltransferase